jgi:hypothetical protein
MRGRTFFIVIAVTFALLCTAGMVQAWRGGYHVGYTHVGPGGVQHWGRTGVAGGYGGYGHYGAYGARYGGVYRGGYGYGGGAYGYRAAYGGGYHYGGYGYGAAYGGYRAGYYRAW